MEKVLGALDSRSQIKKDISLKFCFVLFCHNSVLRQSLNHRNKKLDKIFLRLDKKRFLERNESAFMIPKKFEYLPIRRDETELVQKPVLEVHYLLLSSPFSHFLLSYTFLWPFLLNWS